MLSEAKHLDLFSFGNRSKKRPEILLPRLRDQNDICEMGKDLFSRGSCESRVTPK